MRKIRLQNAKICQQIITNNIYKWYPDNKTKFDTDNFKIIIVVGCISFSTINKKIRKNNA